MSEGDTEPGRRYVGVGAAVYDDAAAYPKLEQAAVDVERVAAALAARDFTAATMASPTAGQVRDGLRGLLSGQPRTVVLHWAGHGKTAGANDLRLVTRDSSAAATRLETCAAPDLLEAALDAGADQILLLVDTCHAGEAVAGVVDMAGQFAAQRAPVDGGVQWVGAVASCQPYGVAVGGRFAEVLLRLLEHGPRSQAYRIHWSAHNEGVRGVDLLYAMLEEWPHPEQVPWHATFGGRSLPMLPNPRYDPEARDRLVEHLVLAARGVAPRERGWFFSGRRRLLSEIVEWMHAPGPGLFVVTGPAGSGKSAVVGRIAALADRAERGELESADGLAADDPDPGAGSVDAVLYCRGADYPGLLGELAAALGVRAAGDPGMTVHAVLDELVRARRLPVVVVDALDEAQPDQLARLLDDLVLPLIRQAKVLVGSRERPLGTDRSVLGVLAPAGAVRDLADEPDTADDIAGYVRRRLAGTANAEEVTGAVARRAARDEGGFLCARLVTGVLRDRPVDTAVPGWETALDVEVESAFDRELAAGPKRHRDGRILPEAARDLLAALGASFGRGLPARDAWPALATALAGGHDGDGVRYDEDDVAWVLEHYGRYVVESGEHGQAVYRLFHQELVDHLAPADDARHRLDLAVGDLWTAGSGDGREPENANPYLRAYGHAHLTRAGERGLAVLRRLAEANPAAYLPHLAMALNNRAILLTEVGRRQEALAPAEEAAHVYRRLTQANPAAHMPGLATALNNLANHLAEVGRKGEALAPAEEAANIYRRLAEADPAAHQPSLAMALNTLASRRAEAGGQPDALAPAGEAVHIYHRLTQANPAAHMPGLAAALNTLANLLSEVGRKAEALAPAEEAVRIRRRLAEANAAVHLPDLAMALNTLASRLAEVGRKTEALAPAEEAVHIRRRLTQTNPAAYLPHLASALSNLANRLSEVGRKTDALAPAEEAARVYRHLAEANPAAYLPGLAMALNNLAVHSARMGRKTDALNLTEEVVRIRRQLSEDNPGNIPHLAGSLNNLANRLAEVGRHQDALAPADESAHIHHRLVESNPAAYLPGLAAALNTQAIRLADAGRHRDALAPAEKSARIRRRLVEADPAAHLADLAMSLNNLANRLSEVGRRPEALAPAEEATGMYRQLAEVSPAAHLPDLAMSLNNLALRLTEVGRLQDALMSADEAVRIYRHLGDANPAAHLPDLATALNNLALRLADMGRSREALASADEAVCIYRGLAEAASLPDLATALNTLANRLAGAGRRQEALAPAEEAVRIRRRLAEAAPAPYLADLATSLIILATLLSEVGRQIEAEDRFDEVVQAFTDRSARAFLLLRRVTGQPQRPTEARVDDALAAFDLASAATPPSGPLVADSHATLRGLRREHPDEFDRVWQPRRADLPAWLTLDDDTIQAVVDWLNTPTWAASRDHLTAHPELLGPPTDVVLAELALRDPDDPVPTSHRQLLGRARADGVDAAYKPLLADELVASWIAAPAWEESRAFLDAHGDELVLPACQAAIVRLADTPDAPALPAHQDLLLLATIGQADAGYQLLSSEAAVRRQVLDAALDAADPQPLAACARLALLASGGDRERAEALLALAVAHALTRRADAAVETARSARALLDDAAVLAWVNRLTTLMGRLEAEAGLLVPLTAALTAPEAPAGRPEAGGTPHAAEPADDGAGPAPGDEPTTHHTPSIP